MKPYLVADVGGTHIRIGLYQADSKKLQQVEILTCAVFSSLTAALQDYLNRQVENRPEHACIAIATALQGDWIQMTNSAWAFSIQAVQNALNLQTLLFVNDFEALALSLPHLDTTQLETISTGQPTQPHATLALLGPGTGLGVSGLVWGAGQWHALAGEGGHTTYVALTQREQAMLAVLNTEYVHVSFERVVSGMGLVNIYRALCQTDGVVAELNDAAAITKAASQQICPRCSEVVDIFCAALGTVAGNVALTLGATGGVYIGGGIVPHLGDYFKNSPFHARFIAKGRFQDYLAAIPVYLINNPVAALLGTAEALQRQLDP